MVILAGINKNEGDCYAYSLTVKTIDSRRTYIITGRPRASHFADKDYALRELRTRPSASRLVSGTGLVSITQSRGGYIDLERSPISKHSWMVIKNFGDLCAIKARCPLNCSRVSIGFTTRPARSTHAHGISGWNLRIALDVHPRLHKNDA